MTDTAHVTKPNGKRTRSTSNDPRGNSASRARRKEKLLSDPQFKHDSSYPEPNVHCVHCGTMLTFDTLEQDRKEPGGSYKYENIQPSCRGCNLQRSDDTTWKGPLNQ